MIDLRLSIEGFKCEQPVVLRLRSSSERDDKSNYKKDALLIDFDGHLSIYKYCDQKFAIKANHSEIQDDVLLIFPNQNTAHRLVRARSKHNTFLITEQCDQLCVMCSQPPKKYHVDLFQCFFEAALLAPEGLTIGLSGGEPLLHKNSLMQLIKEIGNVRPDLSFHVLTNGQHFSKSDIKYLSSNIFENVLWAIPIYSCNHNEHDRIVGKDGAFKNLLETFYIFSKTTARIELRTVLTKSNYHTLPKLSAFINKYIPFVEFWAIMQMEYIGYAKMNWRDEFMDSSLEFYNVGRALNIAKCYGTDVYLYNFPTCTVPAQYRNFLLPAISDWKQIYLDSCNNCSLKSNCGGFFRWYDQKVGFKKVEAQ